MWKQLIKTGHARNTVEIEIDDYAPWNVTKTVMDAGRFWYKYGRQNYGLTTFSARMYAIGQMASLPGVCIRGMGRKE